MCSQSFHLAGSGQCDKTTPVVAAMSPWKVKFDYGEGLCLSNTSSLKSPLVVQAVSAQQLSLQRSTS